jgi:hypothetical protein
MLPWNRVLTSSTLIFQTSPENVLVALTVRSFAPALVLPSDRGHRLASPSENNEYAFIRFFSTHPYSSSLLLVVEGGGEEGQLKLSSIATSARSRFAARR